MTETSPHTSAPVTVWGRDLVFWTRFTVIWLMIITVTGATVRLTGSGLGCTDWPTCNVNTELDAPRFHSTIEFGNRVISGLAIIPVIAAWIGARRARPDLLLLLGLTVAGFIGQVVLGMLVTVTHLDPRVVLGHFLLSIVLIYFGALIDHRARTLGEAVDPSELVLGTELASTLRKHAWLALALTSLIIFLGTLVTGSGPHAGSDEFGDPIPRLGFDIREITRVHSATVWILGVVLAWGLWQVRNSGSVYRNRLLILVGLGAAQGAIGYMQYALGVPELLVGFHIAGSVLLFTAMTYYAAEASRVASAHAAVGEVSRDDLVTGLTS